MELVEFVNAAGKSGDELASPLLSLVVGLEHQLADENFLSHIAALEANVLNNDDVRSGRVKADVTFITAHQAKGMEWDRVELADDDFVVEYSKRHLLYPGNIKPGADRRREEVNMLYVAATRAKRELIISYPATEWIVAERGAVGTRIIPEAWGTCSECKATKRRDQVAVVWRADGLTEGRFDGEPEATMDEEMAIPAAATQVGTQQMETQFDSLDQSSQKNKTFLTNPPSPPRHPGEELLCTTCSHVVDGFLTAVTSASRGWQAWGSTPRPGSVPPGTEATDVVTATQQGELGGVERWRGMVSWGGDTGKWRFGVETGRVVRWGADWRGLKAEGG